MKQKRQREKHLYKKYNTVLYTIIYSAPNNWKTEKVL